MPRYAISGVNDTLLTAEESATGVTAADPTTLMNGQTLMGRDIPSSRVLWLRSAWFYSVSGPVTIALYDASAGVTPTSSNRRFTIRCASLQTTMVDFPAPGLKFATGCVASKDDSAVSAGFQAGQVGGAGYEEA